MAKAKSAYSIPTKKGKLDTHIFVVWVDNEAGVLARVVGLFSGRGCRISVPSNNFPWKDNEGTHSGYSSQRHNG